LLYAKSSHVCSSLFFIFDSAISPNGFDLAFGLVFCIPDKLFEWLQYGSRAFALNRIDPAVAAEIIDKHNKVNASPNGDRIRTTEIGMDEFEFLSSLFNTSWIQRLSRFGKHTGFTLFFIDFVISSKETLKGAISCMTKSEVPVGLFFSSCAFLRRGCR